MNVDVLIVGAGPVGLTAALELERRNIDYRVIDQNEGPTPVEQSRALGVQARTLEIFRSQDIIEPFLETGHQLKHFEFHDRGNSVAAFELEFDGLQTPYPFVLTLSQGRTERFLIDKIEAMGGTIEWETQLTDLENSLERVVADVSKDGDEQRIKSSWLIGADGAHSTVREHLDVPFVGDDYSDNFLLLDATVEWDFRQGCSHFFTHPNGLIAVIPLPETGCVRLIDATDPPEIEEESEALEHMLNQLEQAGYRDVSLEEPLWASSFRIHRRLAGQFREDRCLLAGDSAHIHSPVGGQGMNTGIQDAYNLCWKLSLVLEGTVDSGFLDSYAEERRPVAEDVLRDTDRLTRLATLRNSFLAFCRNTFMKMFSGFGFIRRSLTKTLSEIGLGYRDSSIVRGNLKDRLFTSGLQPGDRVPDLDLAGDNDRSLFDYLRTPNMILLLFAGRNFRPALLLQRVKNRYGDVFDVYLVSTVNDGEEPPDDVIPDKDRTVRSVFGVNDSAVCLVRPDGYLGFIDEPADLSLLEEYLDGVGLQF